MSAAPHDPELEVTELDAGYDRHWFATHPTRRFRVRQNRDGLWLVRRAGRDVMLRVFARSIRRAPHDADQELAAMWFDTAYAGWTSEQIQRAAKRALKPDGKK
jgi:hypothetical protein